MMALNKPGNRTRLGRLMLAILVVNIVLGIFPQGGTFFRDVKAQTIPSPGPAWFNESFEYRILLEVKPFDFEAVNHPTEVDLNLTAIVGKPDFKLDENSLLLIEYTNLDASGVPIQKRPASDPLVADSVPFRHYNDTNFNSKNNAKFTLAWLLDGTTKTSRYYFLYFSKAKDSGKGLALATPNDPKTFGMIDSNYWIQRGMVFYGYNPGEESDWGNVDETEVVGLYNGTSVTILNITDQTQSPVKLADKVIDRGILWRYKVPDGDYFKIIANRPILASVSSAMTPSGSAKTFYPSSDRNLVGRDFILAPYINTNWSGKNYGQQIYGVEESRVSIWDMAGNHIKELDVRKDNHTQLLDLRAGTVYHIKSTGDIIIEQEAINAFSAVPSVTGAPYGRKFFGSIQPFDGEALIIIACEKATVNIHFIDYGINDSPRQLDNRGSYFFLEGAGPNPSSLSGAIMVESTGNVSVIMGSTEGENSPLNVGDDITFEGGPISNIDGIVFNNPGPGKKDHQYPSPFPDGIIFSFFNDTHLTFKGNSSSLHMTMKAGEFYPIKEQGWEFCQINSSRPISLMSLGRGYTAPNAAHRWNDWGSYLAGDLTSPKVVVGLLQVLVYGIDLYPSPPEGAVNDTMIHAVEPGRSTIFKVSVKDIGTYSENVALTIAKVPTGWNGTLDRTQVFLSSGQVTEVLFKVTVPNNTRKDTRMNISIRGDTLREPGKSRNDTVYAEVVVNPVYFPEIVGETVKYIDPGKTATFNLTLTNMGNDHDNITVRIDNSVQNNWKAVLSQTKFGLEPLKNTTLRLDVTAPKNALAGSQLIVDLRAISDTWPNRTSAHRTRTIVNHVYAFNTSAQHLIKVVPGDAGDINLTISNLGNGHDNFSVGITGPAGNWTFDPYNSLGSNAGTMNNISLRFHSPGKDPLTGKWQEGPGIRTVLLNITDDVGIHKSLVVTIQVLQVYALVLSAQSSSLTIRSNQKAVYNLELVNLGNGNDTFTLTTDVDGTFDKNRITLSPSDSSHFNLTVAPPKNKERLIHFEVRAMSLENSSQNQTLTLQVIYPTTSTYVGEYTCLWIVLIAICIFIVVNLLQRRLSKRKRRRHARR